MTDAPGNGGRSSDAELANQPRFTDWLDALTRSDAGGNLPASSQAGNSGSGNREGAITAASPQPAPGGEWIEMLPSGAEVTTAVTELLHRDLELARKVDAVFKDPAFVDFMGSRTDSDDPAQPAPDLDAVQAAVRQIIKEIGERPTDKNAAIRWGLNFWAIAKTMGLIGVLGFGFRTGVQSGTAQSLKLGQPDERTGLAEGVYYTGQAVSSLILLTSAAFNAKDENWDATIGDLIYAFSMLGAVGFAKSYDVAAGLATQTAGGAFFSAFLEVLKRFKTIKAPQLAGVEPTGWGKVATFAAGATTFTLSFLLATPWSYSNDFTGPGGYPDLDPGDRFRKGGQVAVFWATALVGYGLLTPPLVKLIAGDEFGKIGPLEYEAKWQLKSPKDLLKEGFVIANDINKFFAFVLVFNTYLALNGGSRLGPAGEDAIPNEALRIFTNTVISTIFCQAICHIYEMQFGTPKKKKPSEILSENSEGHHRVEAALDEFYGEVVAAEEPIPVADLPNLIAQRAATLQTDAESALFTVLVYTQTVPRAIEEDRISNVASTPPQSEHGGVDAEDPERAALPPEEEERPGGSR